MYKTSRRRKTVAGSLGLLIATTGLMALAPSASASPLTCSGGATPIVNSTASCTAPGDYTLAIPAETLSVHLDVVAGGGAGGRFTAGGNAAEITGTPTLPTGTTALYVVVGAGGATHSAPGIIGVTGGGGGGSAVFALDASNTVIGTVAIAGAGGGGGAFVGDGGNAGSSGTPGPSSTPGAAASDATPGAGGTPAGGGHGANGTTGSTTTGTTLGIGGSGGAQPAGNIGAGGGDGGGGWAGGGGGAWVDYSSASGGGGGSSLLTSGLSAGIRADSGGSPDGDNGHAGIDGAVSLTFQGPTVAGAPTGVSAVRGNGQATVSFSAPSSDGSSTISGYTVTSSPGAITKSCSASPCTVTGLTNGTAYSFTVHATNSIGDSAESAASAAVTPQGLPGAPTAVSATAAYGQATVRFSAPASNGGGAITGYTVTASPSNATTGCVGSPCVVTGLVNGTTYTFSVHTNNGVGPSAESAASNAVSPSAVPVPAPAPTVVVGQSSVTVSWVASTTPGVSGYTVSASPGPATCSTLRASDTSCVIGAVAGTAYKYTVRTLSVAGDSIASPASAFVTATAPSVPTLAPTSAPATLTTTPGSLEHVVAGQQLTVSGTGFAAYSSVTIIAYSRPVVLATITTNATGNFTKQVTLPAGMAIGTHNIVASGVGPSGVARLSRLPFVITAATLVVPGATSTPAATTPIDAAASLANTGVPTATLVELSLLLLVTGGAVSVASRRRTSARTSSR